MTRSRRRTNQRDASKPRAGELAIRVRPIGPTPQELARIAGRLLEVPNVKAYFGRSRHRLLTIEALWPDDSVKSRRTPAPPQRFRATIYDDTRQRTVFADGLLARPSKVNLTESSIQPPITAAEFAEAVRHIARDQELGTMLRAAPSTTYAPMPPLVPMTLPDGRSQRVISVGLLPGGSRPHEIVGVEAASGALHRFADRAPRGARADADGLCGAPVDANQTTADRGTAGQAWITVTQAGKTLWKFLVVRPAASSGTNGSGVELRYVDYRGKRLLYRAHVPILNVKYDGDACGPYRDWQWQEGEIRADGVDVAPGFRLCASPAQTIFDTGSDTGNFLGTAIYVQGQEVVLVSELQAGWYRYISQWRLHTDGTIRPRFAFAAVSSSCVCNVHRTGASISICVRPATTLCASSTPRLLRDGTVGTTCASRWRVRAIPHVIANGASKTPKRMKRTTLSPATTMASKPRVPTRRSAGAISGSFAIIATRSTTACMPSARPTRRTSASGSTVSPYTMTTSWSGTGRTSPMIWRTTHRRRMDISLALT
jgi:hypothetical protein